MSKAKHTPGPWALDYKQHNVEADNEHAIIDAKGVYVGRFTASVRSEDNGKANARLIAAAPDLIRALAAASGYLLNAKIDLEAGAPKRTAIATLEGGLKVVLGALDQFERSQS